MVHNLAIIVCKKQTFQFLSACCGINQMRLLKHCRQTSSRTFKLSLRGVPYVARTKKTHLFSKIPALHIMGFLCHIYIFRKIILCKNTQNITVEIFRQTIIRVIALTSWLRSLFWYSYFINFTCACKAICIDFFS